MFKERFDFIFSLGEDCACAMFLKECYLRDVSSPFDWICHATFDTRINLLLNHFKGFLLQKNMRWFAKPTTGLRDLYNDNYEDTETGFYFFHDFKENVPLEETFNEVKEKYNRRINRLYEKISSHKKVLCVWWSSDKCISSVELQNAQERLSKKFKKQIYLLAFENDPQQKLPKEIIISPYVIKYKANLMGNFIKTTQGDRKVSLPIFKKIKKKGLNRFLFYMKIKKYCIKFFVRFIPIKSVRKKIRSQIK